MPKVKVYITRVLKGKEPIHAIGILNIDKKELYVPFVSKKNVPMIEEVALDFLTNQGEGSYRGETVVDVDGSHFVNVYFLNVLK